MGRCMWGTRDQISGRDFVFWSKSGRKTGKSGFSKNRCFSIKSMFLSKKSMFFSFFSIFFRFFSIFSRITNETGGWGMWWLYGCVWGGACGMLEVR